MSASQNMIPPRFWKGTFKRALVLENPSPLLDEELIKQGFQVERIPDAPTEDELVNILERGQHQLIFKRSKVEINERVVAASKDLAAVMLCCIGDDSVDKEVCAKNGIMVMNDPVSNGRSVAELVIGELIALSRRIFDSVREMNESVWKKNSTARYEILGKTLGIVGYGNIGQQVARLAHALGMDICFYDVSPMAIDRGRAAGFKACHSLKDLLAQSDFVTVHVSASNAAGESNQDLFTLDTFKTWAERPASSPRIFLNLARGFIVSPETIKEAIAKGYVNYVMTDVFPAEPRLANTETWQNPYLDEPRVFATPHIGAATNEAQPRIAKYIARTTELFNRYGMIRDCVFKPHSRIEMEAPERGFILQIVHTDKRGTKKAIDNAIYELDASNLRSAHIDFPAYGIAYDLAVLDRHLDKEELDFIVKTTAELTQEPDAIRWLRWIEAE